MGRTYDDGYTEGCKAIYKRLLDIAIMGLGQKQVDAARLLSERAEAIAVLRDLCESHGDNDWPATLNLADIIDKHLGKHLYAREGK